MTNTVRHAGATLCRVELGRDRHNLLILVTDDGRGIGPGPVGVGTRSMYERAAEVGGELLVASGPDGGTIVTASLPLGVAEAAVDRGSDAGSSLGLDAIETGIARP